MTAAWSLLSFRSAPPSAVIVGTDPICSVLIAFAWKLIRPSTKIIHWCFDLYPEAAIADGLLPQQGFITRMLSRLMHAAYQRCDAIVDIGPCMRRRLSLYRSDALIATVTPWALAESAAPLPIHSDERQRIFGDTSLAVLYSGTMGRAHSYESLLEVARRLRHHNIGFAFSVRGNRTSQLAQAIRPEDRNVRLVPFADQGRLGTRLAAADIHVVSLRESWTGTVIPSKFFGALAAGRPVLFVGSKDSAIAQWIEQFNLGWVLPEHASNLELDCLAECLRELAGNSQRLHDMFLRCHDVYMRHFSRDIILNRWDELLRRLTSAGAPAF
jgi:glycosyltransferase involved in cell wall biosynthesis